MANDHAPSNANRGLDRIARPFYLVIGGALLLAASGCMNFGTPNPITLPPAPADQGWTEDERTAWYTGSQGSRLIPESWLLALETADSDGLFMAPTNFDRFNYPRYKENDKWPIGFARDVQSDEKLGVTRLRWFAGQGKQEAWIGLNCAACHTGRIMIGNETQFIDGGPTLADFQGFTDALTRAMQATADQPAKFDRFAERVLGSTGKGVANKPTLRAALNQLLAHLNALNTLNGTQTVYGHGRLDAVGHILNKVAWLTGADEQAAGEPDAPVSYPFIWNISQHDRLQWNGIVPNDKLLLGRKDRLLDSGALVRNVSEVVGVFADVQVAPDPGLNGFQSSINISNLLAMEAQLARLYPPAWPYEKPDPARVRLGNRLFEAHCAGCHADLPRNDLKTPIVAEMTAVWDPAGIGTDPWMACNAYTYRALAGVLQGTRDMLIRGGQLPRVAPTRAFLKTEAVGVLLGKKGTLVYSALKLAAGKEPRITTAAPPPPPFPLPPLVQEDRETRLARCIADAASADTPQDEQLLLAYKARPLNAIWASAPYLHNGSVRTLYDLLLPAADRPDSFWVGDIAFDRDHVGYIDKQTPIGWRFNTKGPDGKPIHGNSKLGHDYNNAQFSEEQRLALVEYMKTL